MQHREKGEGGREEKREEGERRERREEERRGEEGRGGGEEGKGGEGKGGSNPVSLHERPRPLPLQSSQTMRTYCLFLVVIVTRSVINENPHGWVQL